MLAFLGIIGVGMTYLGVWLYRRDLSLSNDLKKLSVQRHLNKLNLFQKKKLKGY